MTAGQAGAAVAFIAAGLVAGWYTSKAHSAIRSVVQAERLARTAWRVWWGRLSTSLAVLTGIGAVLYLWIYGYLR